MGLFDKLKKDSPEKIEAMEKNQQQLMDFVMTKAWGVKKYRESMQFIYDNEHKQFVVVEGPEDTFRERNPWIVSFDQVQDVSLEVDEYWTQTGKLEDHLREPKQLLQKDYDKVYWRYDFYINIKTSHPYAKNIRFKTNYGPTIVRVQKQGIFYRRGLEIGGEYKGKEITDLIEKMNAMIGKDKEVISTRNTINLLTNQEPDGVMGKLARDSMDEKYISRLENMIGHIQRAQRISTLLL